MNEYNDSSQGIDTIDQLQKENKFAEAFILSWGIIEFILDTAVLEEYRLPKRIVGDPRVETILDINFRRKLDLQEKLKTLSKKDARIVIEVAEKRNMLFHEGLLVTTISESEKQEIMKITRHAILILHKVLDSAINQNLSQRR